MIHPKLRYGALLAACPELLDPARRVLEIGGGTEGLARFLGHPVVTVDHEAGAAAHASRRTVCAAATLLPFGDAAFDDVVYADALAGLARDERARALAECIRVAARRVLIITPAGAFAASAEAAYAEDLARRGRPVPGALQASLAHGIPALADLLELLTATGRAFTIGCNESITAHYAAVLLDEHSFLDRYLAPHDRKSPLEPPLAAAEGDLPYSFLVAIDTTRAKAAGDAAPSPAFLSFPPAPPVPAARTAAPTMKIFAASHRLDRMPPIPGITWVHGGAAGAAIPPGTDVLRDDAGPNISARNPAYSEMTPIYWVWRNVTGLDAVGFCQYRRYFNFRTGPPPPERETYLRAPGDVLRLQRHFVDRALISARLAAGAIIVTRPMPLIAQVPEQYMIGHVAAHYMAMVDCVLERHPGYAADLIAQARDRHLYGCNMFVMPWADFDRLCRFWFDCLFALEERIAVKDTGYQGRVFAFLSERIFDLHIRHLIAAGRAVDDYPIFCLYGSAFPPTSASGASRMS